MTLKYDFTFLHDSLIQQKFSEPSFVCICFLIGPPSLTTDARLAKTLPVINDILLFSLHSGKQNLPLRSNIEAEGKIYTATLSLTVEVFLLR